MNQDIGLTDVARALYCHKVKSLIFFAAAVLASLALTIFLPKSYRSESLLFLRLGRENVVLDPTASFGEQPVVALPQSREDEINSVVEMLQSRAMLEKVVDAVGPGPILGHSGETRTTAIASQTGWLPSLPFRTPLSDRERAVIGLGEEITVERASKSNVILVTYQSPSPELSREIVSRLTSLYVDQHARLNRSSGAQEFFDGQTSRLRDELTRSEEELRRLKEETGLMVPEKQSELTLTRIDKLERDLSRASQDRAACETKVRRLKERLAAMPSTRIAGQIRGVGNEGTDSMRQQFYALQLKEQELKATQTPDHPKLVEVREQVAAARNILEQEERTRTQITEGPNRAYEELELDLLREEPLLESIDARMETLRGQLAELNEHLKRINVAEIRIASVQREVELRDATYRKYAINLEQSRIDQALEAGRISNITVAQPASFEPKPVSPRKAVIMALGTLVGLFGALGLALLAEYLHASLRSRADVERRLRVPVLTEIPRLKRNQLVFNGRS